MAEEKRYYWLKLQEDFYDEDTIQWIEEQENGEAYVNFYLKLLLKSLADDGYLIRYVGKRLIPYDVKSLANLTRTDADTVRVAMDLFKQLGLVEILEGGEIYMSQINEMIGSETQAAKRMRRMRAKETIAIDTKNERNNVTGERNSVTDNRNNVQECYTEYRDKRYRDKSIENRVHTGDDFTTIIDRWNELDKNIPRIQSLNPGTQRYNLLTARINEYGFDKVVDAIDQINSSSFLKGYVTDFVISFDWFIKPNNFIKVLEGNYRDKEASAGPSPGGAKSFSQKSREKRIAKMLEDNDEV